MNRAKLYSVVGALAFMPVGATSWAAAPKRSKPSLPAPSGVVVIERSAAEYASADATSVARPRSKVSVGLSSWVPSSMSLPSNLAGTTAFHSNGLPGFYANLFRPVLGQDFALRLGGGWSAFDREADLDLGGASLRKVQTLHLFSARVGLEYAPAALAFRYLEPMISISALPSIGVATRSGFDSNSTYYGLLGEISLGARVPVGSGWALEVAGIGTVGALDRGHAEGLGLHAGLRVSL